MDRLQSMEVFQRVVDLASFTRAADHLNLSKATVTAHIAALEGRLGVRLLQRTTRRLSLTDDGAAYLEHVRRVLADVEETESILSRARTVPRGRLRVDVPLTLGRQHIVPALPRFAAQYPELKVVATLDDRRIDLVAERVDAAVRVGTLDDSSIIARKVYETGLVACASPDYLALHGAPQTPQELAAHNCIGRYNVDTRRALEWRFERDGERTAFVPEGVLTVSSADAIVDAAIAGAGIIYMLEMAVSRHLISGALKPVLQDWRPRERIPISVIYPQNRHLSPKVRVFVDFVAGLFPQTRPAARRS